MTRISLPGKPTLPLLLLLFAVLLGGTAGKPQAQNRDKQPKAPAGARGYAHNAFQPLYDLLPAPNQYRTGAGAPGPAYWQQKADYDIEVTLNDQKQQIIGSETITYTNNSPNALSYLWVQLDQNVRAQEALSHDVRPGSLEEEMTFDELGWFQRKGYDGGFKIEKVAGKRGDALPHTIRHTMMRIELAEPLESGEQFEFQIDWRYNINNQPKTGGRSGYEYFEADDNYLYVIAQWFPRMAVYNDRYGWQNKQFLGRGEFALNFGDYHVELTVPRNHVVTATGELQNPKDVLTTQQRDRLARARSNFEEPVQIITQEEAKANEQQRSEATRTWVFEAERVRDFAFASSRKFLWDAMAVKLEGREEPVLAQSFYPKEGLPLWQRYSTRANALTLKTYSEFSVPYPYPHSTAIHGPVFGMEYPMISFCKGRPQPDGTYTEQKKHMMIELVIHEVGHNFFPMVINSDERRWTWMDEGFNTFLQFQTEQRWKHEFPSRRGFPADITGYMDDPHAQQVPLMTNSESILQFGNNAYGKTATALNILRETIMGREAFDYAFKTYCERWAFKHPTPADFFRTMEDASAISLDWFFRGWFFSTDHVDLAIESVDWYTFSTHNPEVEDKWAAEHNNYRRESISGRRNNARIDQTLVEKLPGELKDFYAKHPEQEVTEAEREEYQQFLSRLTEEQKKLLASELNLYQVNFRNVGGLEMPLILRFTFEDGSEKMRRIPAAIWRKNNTRVSKVFRFEKKVEAIRMDPYQETADTQRNNNYYGGPWDEQRLKLRPAREDDNNRMRQYQDD